MDSNSYDNTKEQEVASILDGFREDCYVRKHALRGNNLWVLLDTPDKSVIVLALLQSGSPDMGYGYKILGESCGLYEVNCPVSWLDIAPLPDERYAPRWRDEVHAYHAKQRIKRGMAVGQVWRLRDGHNAPDDRCELIAKRKRGWVGRIAGQQFKVMPRMLAERIG